MSVDERLLAHVLGLLPAGERAELDARLARDPKLAARRRRLQQQLDELDPSPPDWLLPLPGNYRGRVVLQASVTMDAWLDLGPNPFRPASILLRGAETLLDHRLLVLVEEEDRWRLHEPPDGQAPRRLSELPQSRGGRRLDLVLVTREAQEWALVLLPPQVAPELVGGDAGQLEAVRLAVEELQAPAVTVLLD